MIVLIKYQIVKIQTNKMRLLKKKTKIIDLFQRKIKTQMLNKILEFIHNNNSSNNNKRIQTITNKFRKFIIMRFYKWLNRLLSQNQKNNQILEIQMS